MHNNNQQKMNYSLNYHKDNKNRGKRIIHEHANSFSNNLYVNLLNKIKKEYEEKIDSN